MCFYLLAGNQSGFENNSEKEIVTGLIVVEKVCGTVSHVSRIADVPIIQLFGEMVQT